MTKKKTHVSSSQTSPEHDTIFLHSGTWCKSFSWFLSQLTAGGIRSKKKSLSTEAAARLSKCFKEVHSALGVELAVEEASPSSMASWL